MKLHWVGVLFSASLAGCLGYAPGQQSYWDAQVREMCAKDGGTHVFEVVELSESHYALLLNKFGKLAIPFDDSTTANAPLFRKESISYIRDANPSVRRYELTVTRKSDKKILGRQVTYSRVGGDFPSPAHHSSFSCPRKQVNLFSAVVKLRGEEK